MDPCEGTERYHAELKQPIRERQSSQDFLPRWNLRNSTGDHRGREANWMGSHERGRTTTRDSCNYRRVAGGWRLGGWDIGVRRMRKGVRCERPGRYTQLTSYWTLHLTLMMYSMLATWTEIIWTDRQTDRWQWEFSDRYFAVNYLWERDLMCSALCAQVCLMFNADPGTRVSRRAHVGSNQVPKGHGSEPGQLDTLAWRNGQDLL